MVIGKAGREFGHGYQYFWSMHPKYFGGQVECPGRPAEGLAHHN